MFPHPITATRSCSDTMTCFCPGELLPDTNEHASTLGRGVAVEGVVLDAYGTRVADREQLLDAGGDVRAALSVHTRDVRAGCLDVLQVDVEEPIGQVADRGDRVVALCRPPAGVDRRAEHVGVLADRVQHLARSLLGMVLEPEPHAVRPQNGRSSVAIAA